MNVLVIKCWEEDTFEQALSSRLSDGWTVLHINTIFDPEEGNVDKQICFIAVLHYSSSAFSDEAALEQRISDYEAAEPVEEDTEQGPRYAEVPF